MNEHDLTRISATVTAQEVRAGITSATDVAETILARITLYDAVQPQVWISLQAPDRLLAAAAAIDARVRAGEDLPLAGVPFAVKDNIDAEGFLTTAGCPAFAYQPSVSAHVVRQLLDAGALLVGKTNLDQFATGLVGARSPYGIPHCVFNQDYVSGGSSSGSSVAVAAGLVAFSLGTDTAGSGRVPAAFNHLIGLKPSRGRWSTSGLLPACRSLDCITVFANDPADARLVDSVVAGFDANDIFARVVEDLPAPVGRIRLGVPLPDQLNWCGDMASARLFEAALKRAEAMGAELVPVDIGPLLDCAKLLYQGPYVAERLAAIKAFAAQNPFSIHSVVRGIVLGGAAYSAVDVFEAEYQRMHYLRGAQEMWGGIDALMLPTTPTIYRIEEVLDEPVALNSNLGLYTNFVNLLDMSAIAAPAGFRENGTGFGVSFIGPAGADRWLVDLAESFLAAEPDYVVPELALLPRRAAVKLAVVGAHLNGMPLHWQLTSRSARFVRGCKTAPTYRLYAMANSSPAKPALVFDETGSSIDVEVYELDQTAFGGFTEEVPAPLAIGSVVLDDGEVVKGFVAEPRALLGAQDITHLGGWRAFMAQKR